VVLGGADFGAGWWQLGPASGERGARMRELAHDSMAPVWEANHVWLIFVLTVTWTAYPAAFGSIASTLCVALFLAAVGIIFRGALYALRIGTSTSREERVVDMWFGVASLVTPFALGAAAGGIASGRVPVGNAAGDLFSSWLNPTSIAIGALFAVTGVYLSAVYLSADARRLRIADLEEAFRARALVTGVIAGAVAVAGLIVVHGDAPALYHGLVHGDGLAALVLSGLAGLATLGLVFTRRFELARVAAAAAVAAIVIGWALAQSPRLLPGLTVEQAAASHDTLVAVVAAVLAGILILFPSLGTLFRLVLHGRLDSAPPEQSPPAPEPGSRTLQAPAAVPRVAAALLIVGFALVNVADSEVAHGVGAISFLAAIALGFYAVLLASARRSTLL
jgi:cytochrome bd ubiquinol oxidase subunit II